jgi:hypothetical protein
MRPAAKRVERGEGAALPDERRYLASFWSAHQRLREQHRADAASGDEGRSAHGAHSHALRGRGGALTPRPADGGRTRERDGSQRELWDRTSGRPLFNS